MAGLTDRSKGELAGIVALAMQDGDPGELLDVVAEAIASEAGDGVDGLLALADFLARPDKLAAPRGLPRLAELLQEGHGERVELTKAPFRPRTPREALLAIKAETATVHVDTDPYEIITPVERLVEAGLAPTDPGTFEWTDRLAERLAQAIVVLEKVDKEGFPDDAELEGQVQEAITLPPDIEAAVDVRRHRS